MADQPSDWDLDSEESAVLGKMDALIARHRGTGLDPNVPVLTDLDPGAVTQGGIPVLTSVESAFADDLMFTPDEIRALAVHEPAPVAAPTPAPVATPPAGKPAAVAPVAAKPVAPVVPDLIAVPDIAPKAKPVEAAAPAPMFDFPEIRIPESKTAAAKTAASAGLASPAPPAPGDLLMPELSLNFDFPSPDEPKAATPAVVAPPLAAPPPAPVAAAPDLVPVAAPRAMPAASVPMPAVAPAPAPASAPAAAATRLTSDAFPDLSLELEETPAAAGEAPDVTAMTSAVLDSLRPELERLVRAELARQLPLLHAEAVKLTLGALQPQLDKLVASRIVDLASSR